MSRALPLIVNGWQIHAHERFLAQFESLIFEVEKLRAKYPDSYQKKAATKRLEAIYKRAFRDIPQDPTRDEYRQGTTLGDDNKHWFRIKFYQQYRLFFRYRKEGKLIVLGWVNDPDTKRAYGSKTDAYAVFEKMLESDQLPNDWNALLAAARSQDARLNRAVDDLLK